MELNEGKDSRGPYYTYGTNNTKHYYRKGNKSLQSKARANAEDQGRRIESKGK